MGLKAYSGIGTVYMRPVTAAGVATGDFRQVGTVEPLSIEIKNDQVKVKGRTVENSGQNIAAKNKLTDMTGKMTLKEWNAANLAWALSGSYTSQVASGNTVSDEALTVGVPGDWKELAHRDVSSVVVTSSPAGTTYTVDVDYKIDAKLGLITSVAGGALAAGTVATLIDYTYAAKTGYSVAIGSSTQIRVEILAHLYNEYQDEHWVLELDSVILGANKEINFISAQDSEGEMLEFSMTPEILSGATSCGRVNGISL